MKSKLLESVFVYIWKSHFESQISEDRALELVDTLKLKSKLNNYFSVLMNTMT